MNNLCYFKRKKPTPEQLAERLDNFVFELASLLGEDFDLVLAIVRLRFKGPPRTPHLLVFRWCAQHCHAQSGSYSERMLSTFLSAQDLKSSKLIVLNFELSKRQRLYIAGQSTKRWAEYLMSQKYAQPHLKELKHYRSFAISKLCSFQELARISRRLSSLEIEYLKQQVQQNKEKKINE